MAAVQRSGGLSVKRIGRCHADQVVNRVRSHRIGDAAAVQENQGKKHTRQRYPHPAGHAVIQMAYPEFNAVDDDRQEGALPPNATDKSAMSCVKGFGRFEAPAL